MSDQFADRMGKVQKSFIREILKVTQKPEVISFAGGLPNPHYFPVDEVAQATEKALRQHGQQMLQYAPTAGYLKLREYIAQRYLKRFNLVVDPDDILITNGSQQGLDLMGKALLNDGDTVALESPSYLGAIQALAMFQPNFVTIPLSRDGIDIEQFLRCVEEHKPKLMYLIPDFQNPTGISYTDTVRQEVANILSKHQCMYVEDNPYGELRFQGDMLSPLRGYGANHGALMGSFSKVVAPGFRLGWIVAPPALMEKLVIAKQAADLHSNNFTQYVLAQFLEDNDLDTYIDKIRGAYSETRQTMLKAMEAHFPKEVEYTLPDGGMFIWATLPEGVSSLKLFDEAVKNNVAFVPGAPFYIDESDHNEGDRTLRLNFSTPTHDQVVEGIERLGLVMKNLLNS